MTLLFTVLERPQCPEMPFRHYIKTIERLLIIFYRKHGRHALRPDRCSHFGAKCVTNVLSAVCHRLSLSTRRIILCTFYMSYSRLKLFLCYSPQSPANDHDDSVLIASAYLPGVAEFWSTTVVIIPVMASADIVTGHSYAGAVTQEKIVKRTFTLTLEQIFNIWYRKKSKKIKNSE